MAILQVPITKAKGEFITIDTDDEAAMPASVFKEALLQGMKVILNRGTSKITKSTYPDADELKAAAIAKAQEQLELVKTEKIKFTGATKAKKASGAVMTEARRLARNLVKDAIKAEGKKVSHFKASEITKIANLYLESDLGPELIKTAESNLAARAVPAGIDLKALLIEDPALVKKAETAKANKPISAKQAGMTKKHKPGTGATAH